MALPLRLVPEIVRLHNLPRCVFCGLVLSISCQQRLRSVHKHLKQHSHQLFLLVDVGKHFVHDFTLDATIPGNKRAVEQGAGVGQQVGHLGVLANLKACTR